MAVIPATPEMWRTFEAIDGLSDGLPSDRVRDWLSHNGAMRSMGNPPRRSGKSRALLKLSIALVENGLDVLVVCSTSAMVQVLSSALDALVEHSLVPLNSRLAGNGYARNPELGSVCRIVSLEDPELETQLAKATICLLDEVTIDDVTLNPKECAVFSLGMPFPVVAKADEEEVSE